MLLHGYGADGKDLIEIGRQWQRLLPHAAFVAPNAPERMPMSPAGRQWFALTLREPGERWKGVTQARPALDAFLDAELIARAHAFGARPRRVQPRHHDGAAFRVPPLTGPTAIVGYSGLLVLEPGKGPEALMAEARSKPPILLVHGEADDLIPASALFDLAEALAKAEIPCEWHLSPGLGHGIDGEGLRQGGEFIAAAFARARRASAA